MRHLYFAYGSNLDREQFARRCPDSRPVCRALLRGWRLRFAGGGHADVVPGRANDVVRGALYDCSDDDVAALDRYEGVRWRDLDGGYYRRWLIDVEREDGTTVEAEVYVMTPGHEERAPADHYVATIRRGYEQWGIKARAAVLRAFNRLTERERYGIAVVSIAKARA